MASNRSFEECFEEYYPYDNREMEFDFAKRILSANSGGPNCEIDQEVGGTIVGRNMVDSQEQDNLEQEQLTKAYQGMRELINCINNMETIEATCESESSKGKMSVGSHEPGAARSCGAWTSDGIDLECAYDGYDI